MVTASMDRPWIYRCQLNACVKMFRYAQYHLFALVLPLPCFTLMQYHYICYP
jgi:hypothetical protein